MSIKHKETIACPKCGKNFEINIWQSLNGDIDPAAKQQLLDGSLFRPECPHCGQPCGVDYPVIYHDMIHNAIVYYVHPESVEQTKEEFARALAELDMTDVDLRKRIVTSRHSLREKAVIFEHELDDRVIEMIKVVYYMQATEQHPDANIREIVFMIDEGKYFLAFIGDKDMTAEVDPKMYDLIRGRFAAALTAGSDPEMIIDAAWAMQHLQG